MHTIRPAGDHIKHSLKLDRYFSLPLCEEDLSMIRNFCADLGFSPKPRPVGRSLIRFAFDSVSQGLVTIQSVYKTYNALSVSQARHAPDNPVRRLNDLIPTHPLPALLSPEAEATFQEWGLKRAAGPEDTLLEWLELAAHVYARLGVDYEWRRGEARDEMLLRRA